MVSATGVSQVERFESPRFCLHPSRLTCRLSHPPPTAGYKFARNHVLELQSNNAICHSPKQIFVANTMILVSNIVAKGATKIVQTGDPNVNCGVFASAAVTGYTAVKNLLATLNPLSTPVPTTSDEDFLIFPLHGSISHDDGILVYKGATLPPGFGTTEGVTMGKIIYSIFDPSDAVVSGSNFAKSAGLLLHEFTHTKQYKALGYDTNAFGTKYMFQFCKVRTSPFLSFLPTL